MYRTEHGGRIPGVSGARDRRALRSTAIAGLTIVGLGAVLAGGSAIVTNADEYWNPSLTLAAIGAVFLLLGLGGGPILRASAVARVQRSHPSALVMLALREPALVPDLPTYQYRKANTARVPDTWVVALVDSRGISAWSGGFRPKELILIEWSEIATVTAVSFTSIAGRRRFGAAVDVRPFATPMLVRVGHSAFGVEGSFDREGVLAIVDATNSQRPA